MSNIMFYTFIYLYELYSLHVWVFTCFPLSVNVILLYITSILKTLFRFTFIKICIIILFLYWKRRRPHILLVSWTDAQLSRLLMGLSKHWKWCTWNRKASAKTQVSLTRFLQSEVKIIHIIVQNNAYKSN